MKKLTIGMPTCSDYSGALFTVRSLMDTDVFDQGKIEILVVDNTQEESYRTALKNQIVGIGSPNVRYEEFTEKRGPAETKNKVIEKATCEYVMCIDGHVLFKRGIIDRLVDFLENLEEDKKDDFFTGPLIGNDGSASTHFDNVWRGEMKGIWATDNSLIEDDELKPIWAQGCGLFLVRRESWLGFNKKFKGFGGEEGYIHDKYRKYGRQVYLIPWLGWWHRFGNPDTKHYLLTRYSKVRNYIIGYLELGQPVSEVYNHFVSLHETESLPKHLIEEHSVSPEYIEGKTHAQLQTMHKTHKLSQFDWDHILANLEEHEDPIKDLVKEAYDYSFNGSAHDLKEHMHIIKAFASKCETVSEVTRRIPSSTAALAGRPKKLRSFTFEVAPNTFEQDNFTCSRVNDFDDGIEKMLDEESDMVFLKFPHTYDNTTDLLHRVADKTNKYILIHDTMKDYRLDITEAMKSLVATGEWFVHLHSNKQWGLTVLGRTEPAAMVFAWDPEPGVGAEVKKLLSKIGIEATEGCACNARAKEMDARGPEWCLKNQDLISGWFEQEAKKRKLPYLHVAGKALLLRAVKRYNNRKLAKEV